MSCIEICVWIDLSLKRKLALPFNDIKIKVVIEVFCFCRVVIRKTSIQIV